MAIVNDRQRSQRFNGNHQCSDCSDLNGQSDLSDYMEIIAERSQRLKDRVDRGCPSILTMAAIVWNSILSDRENFSDRMSSNVFLLMVTIVNDHMETKLN